MPKAVLILYLRASLYVRSVPAITSSALARSCEPGGKRSAISGGKGWVLSQMPRSAMSSAVGSSIRWPCSMQRTPASIERLDRFGGVGVDGDVGAPVFGGLDGGAELGLGEGRGVERAVGRGDAAAGRELDLGRAEQQLFARAEADFVGAVGDACWRRVVPCARAGRRAAGHFVRLAEVAVAAGDGDDRAGRVDARAGREAFVDARLRPNAGPPRSRTVVKPRSRVSRASAAARRFGVADVVGDRFGGRGPDEHRVPVGVDQAGHERAAAARG